MKKFIVFEGLDGSGKTTQVKLLANSLKKIKKDFFFNSRTWGDKNLRNDKGYFSSKKKSEISPYTELLLIYAARYEHVKKKNHSKSSKKKLLFVIGFLFNILLSNFCK